MRCCNGKYDKAKRYLTNKLPKYPMNFDGERHHQDQMIYLTGGEFLMGTEDKDAHASDHEGPTRKVEVRPFYVDRYPITNKQFQAFIQATGYQTDAERFGWSFVFYLLLSESTAKQVKHIPVNTPWWRVVEGADWAHPEGPDSFIDHDRLDHPVVHISWNDAVAYCHWSGKRLLTEVEWEYAARGGLTQKRYPWGNELTPNGEHRCNIWQGEFPTHNAVEDGYMGTCPVDRFPANDYGLYSVVGNTWEWCANDFSGKYNSHTIADEAPKSMRGGSYLCHQSYCNRYRVAARSSNTPDSSSGNLGFRCARDAE